MPAKSKFAEIEATLAAPSNSCKLCAFLAAAPEEDAAFIRNLLQQPVVIKGHAHIGKVLAAGGVKLGDKSVANHRTHHMKTA